MSLPWPVRLHEVEDLGGMSQLRSGWILVATFPEAEACCEEVI